MKKNNLYLILSVIMVVALTVFLGYSLREYYKADADALEKNNEDFLVTLRDNGMETLNYATVESPASTYTIVNNGDFFVIEGFEDVPVEQQMLLTFAKSLTSVKGVPIPSSEKAFKQYGINGKTTITAHYIDNTTMTFRVGEPFENKIPCYIDENSQLYFFPSDFLSERKLAPNDFVKKLITDVPENSEIKSISLLGECRPLPISLEEQPAAGKEPRYMVTEPEKSVINKMDLESALGQIFMISAIEAEVLEPKPEDILEYGLDKPFSIMSLSTNHDSFLLKTTRPTPDNTAFIMRDDTPVIYKVNTEGLAWITAQQEDLVPAFYIPPPLKEIGGLQVITDDKAYVFDVEHTENSVTITIGGKYIPPCIFEKFVDNITRISAKDFVGETIDLPPTLKIEISYKESDKGSDTIEFLSKDEELLVSINGEVRYTTTTKAIDRILTNCENIVKGKCLT